MHTHIHVYICIYIHVYIYIYAYYECSNASCLVYLQCASENVCKSTKIPKHTNQSRKPFRLLSVQSYEWQAYLQTFKVLYVYIYILIDCLHFTWHFDLSSVQRSYKHKYDKRMTCDFCNVHTNTNMTNVWRVTFATFIQTQIWQTYDVWFLQRSYKHKKDKLMTCDFCNVHTNTKKTNLWHVIFATFIQTQKRQTYDVWLCNVHTNKHTFVNTNKTNVWRMACERSVGLSLRVVCLYSALIFARCLLVGCFDLGSVGKFPQRSEALSALVRQQQQANVGCR
jgi:hypothetical protein